MRIRHILLLLICVSILCVCIPYQRRRQAVLKVIRLGGDIHYHKSSGIKKYANKVMLPLFGSEGCLDVKEIYFSGWKLNAPKKDFLQIDPSIVDKDLVVLKHFPHLNRLNLSGRTITDKGLLHLRQLKELQILCLDSTNVTCDGLLETIKHLPGLVLLSVENVKLLEGEAKKLRGALPLGEVVTENEIFFLELQHSDVPFVQPDMTLVP